MNSKVNWRSEIVRIIKSGNFILTIKSEYNFTLKGFLKFGKERKIVIDNVNKIVEDNVVINGSLKYQKIKIRGARGVNSEYDEFDIEIVLPRYIDFDLYKKANLIWYNFKLRDVNIKRTVVNKKLVNVIIVDTDEWWACAE